MAGKWQEVEHWRNTGIPVTGGSGMIEPNASRLKKGHGTA
jgi:hypothetical protein